MAVPSYPQRVGQLLEDEVGDAIFPQGVSDGANRQQGRLHNHKVLDRAVETTRGRDVQDDVRELVVFVANVHEERLLHRRLDVTNGSNGKEIVGLAQLVKGKGTMTMTRPVKPDEHHVNQLRGDSSVPAQPSPARADSTYNFANQRGHPGAVLVVPRQCQPVLLLLVVVLLLL